MKPIQLSKLKKLIKKQDEICKKCRIRPLCKQFYCIIMNENENDLESWCIWDANKDEIRKITEDK